MRPSEEAVESYPTWCSFDWPLQPEEPCKALRKGWLIARNTGPDYIAQLTREKVVEKKNARGIPEQVWHQIHRDNHLGDCEKMQLVFRYIIGEAVQNT